METMTMKEGMEVSKEISKTDTEFDPDRRIDLYESEMDPIKGENGDSYDPDKRIDGEREEQREIAENGEKKGLTEEEKTEIAELTRWSDEIVDAIGSKEEAKIYIEAGLEEAEIGGKKCLVRNDIDWGQKDEMGRTNKERAEQGLSPISKDGQTVELHHIGQHADSPLAELTTEEHRGKGNDAILHDKAKESEINRTAFAGERSSHWEARSPVGGNL